LLHKFSSTCDITILLIVTCIVMYDSSNHAVKMMVVVLFLYFTMKFIICVVSSHILCFVFYLFICLLFIVFLLFIYKYSILQSTSR
jgi:hypothetical protein